MDKKVKKLRLNKETIESLTNEHLKEAAGGTLSGVDTCGLCTLYNCGYSYRNCPSSPQNPCES